MTRTKMRGPQRQSLFSDTLHDVGRVKAEVNKLNRG